MIDFTDPLCPLCHLPIKEVEVEESTSKGVLVDGYAAHVSCCYALGIQLTAPRILDEQLDLPFFPALATN